MECSLQKTHGNVFVLVEGGSEAHLVVEWNNNFAEVGQSHVLAGKSRALSYQYFAGCAMQKTMHSSVCNACCQCLLSSRQVQLEILRKMAL